MFSRGQLLITSLTSLKLENCTYAKENGWRKEKEAFGIDKLEDANDAGTAKFAD